MQNSKLELLRVFIDGESKNARVEVKCKVCGQIWKMWRSHYYRGDTPCDCHHWKKQYPRLYSIYTNMKTRCYNENNPNYIHYGKRGISVCDEWLDSFIHFKDWALSNGYSDDLTIERIDVNGDYEPNNCTWITSEQQGSNKTNTIRFENTSLRNWCIQQGLKYKLVHQYMKRHQELTLEEVIMYYLNKYEVKELYNGCEEIR